LGATTATAIVPTTADTIDENNDFHCSHGTTGTVGSTTDTAIGTIEDNDAPVVTIEDILLLLRAETWVPSDIEQPIGYRHHSYFGHQYINTSRLHYYTGNGDLLGGTGCSSNRCLRRMQLSGNVRLSLGNHRYYRVVGSPQPITMDY
jgi:hypothetical protein